MPRYVLSEWVQHHDDTGPVWMPAAAIGVAEWAAIDLRPDPTQPGPAFVRFPAEERLSFGDVDLGDGDRLPKSTKVQASTMLGAVERDTVGDLLADLFVRQADGARADRLNPLRLNPRTNKFEIVCGGEVLWERPAISGGATVSDDFNRADGAIGGDWSVVRGTWTVESNRARVAGGSVGALALALYATALDTPDLWVEVTYAEGAFSNSHVAGVVGRASAGDNFYYAWLRASASATDALGKSVAGSRTALGTSSGSALPGTVRLTCDGSSISHTKNGTLAIGPVTDTTFTTGSVVGLHGHPAAAQSEFFDDFSGADLGAPQVGAVFRTANGVIRTAGGILRPV